MRGLAAAAALLGLAALLFLHSRARGPETVPVDAVYTWVNGSDPQWLGRQARARGEQLGGGGHLGHDAAHASRYVDNEELRYSLRSLETFAPWIRHIYLVTDGQTPYWLNTRHSRITMVHHREIFANASHLPTFSSPAIEANLHRIPGLAERFIYLNDDVMFGRPVDPSDFITPSSGQKVYLAWNVPNCNEGCPPNWIRDGYCDVQCNVSACDWDGGDCANATNPGSMGSRGAWGAQHGAGWHVPQATNQYCSRGCPSSWIGDKYCDRACKTLACGFDAGDCGLELVIEGLKGVAILEETDRVVVPEGELAFYLNLTGLVGDARITDGSHDREDAIRTATISQKDKWMTLTFLTQGNVTRREADVFLEWEDDSGKHNKTFAVLCGGMLEEETGAPTEAPTTALMVNATGEGDDINTDVPASNADPSAPASSGASITDSTGRRLLAIDDLLHPMGTGERLGSSKYPWTKRKYESRKLLDVYGDSLKHVNALYNRRFGSLSRKVPAHMPHFIQRSVMERLQETFPEEWAATSSHRFRSSEDMQFAFAYFYFLINERISEPWLPHLVDTDGDGVLTRNEFRTAWSIAFDTPLNEDDMESIFNVLTTNGTEPLIMAELVGTELEGKLREAWSKLPRNPTEIHDTDEVAFVMVRNNDTQLLSRLDGIRRRRHKFICLNDNLEHDDPDTPRVKQVLRDFYDAILPKPSAFELQPGQIQGWAFLFWLVPGLLLIGLCGYASLLTRQRKRD